MSDRITHTKESFFHYFEKYIQELETIFRSPDLYIIDYCSSIKTQIDVLVETILMTTSLNDEQIVFINLSRNAMINRLDEHERECLRKFDHEEFRTQISERLRTLIEASKNDLEYLKSNYTTDEKWFSNENRALEMLRKKLQHDVLNEIQLLKKTLFLNRYYIFKENPQFESDQIVFGNLIELNEIFNEKIINFLM